MDKILVIGSSNTDLITKVIKLPEGGETIEGVSSLQAMGGKGANQAMAAHKLGGDVNFITCLGNDSYGQSTLNYYNQEELKVADSRMVDDIPSGTAMILVDEKGENVIVITPGANNMLSSEFIEKKTKVFDEADLVLLQMEIPYNTIMTICEIAHNKKKRVILNAAPARPLDEHLIRMVDILIVNETEAETIAGKKIDSIGREAIVDALLALGANTVILTLGEKGCCLKNQDLHISIPAFKVNVKDTTGAGDTFCGALAVGLAKGEDWIYILEYATAASAICVTRMGAQPSIPKENEVTSFMRKKLTSLNQPTVSNGNGKTKPEYP